MSLGYERELECPEKTSEDGENVQTPDTQGRSYPCTTLYYTWNYDVWNQIYTTLCFLMTRPPKSEQTKHGREFHTQVTSPLNVIWIVCFLQGLGTKEDAHKWSKIHPVPCPSQVYVSCLCLCSGSLLLCPPTAAIHLMSQSPPVALSPILLNTTVTLHVSVWSPSANIFFSHVIQKSFTWESKCPWCMGMPHLFLYYAIPHPPSSPIHLPLLQYRCL